jgi:hypothetical protein
MAPKMDAFCKEIPNIQTLVVRKTSGPKMDAGCLLWQTWSEHGRLSRLKHSAPKRMPFISLYEPWKNNFFVQDYRPKWMQ